MKKGPASKDAGYSKSGCGTRDVNRARWLEDSKIQLLPGPELRPLSITGHLSALALTLVGSSSN